MALLETLADTGCTATTCLAGTSDDRTTVGQGWSRLAKVGLQTQKSIKTGQKYRKYVEGYRSEFVTFQLTINSGPRNILCPAIGPPAINAPLNF